MAQTIILLVVDDDAAGSGWYDDARSRNDANGVPTILRVERGVSTVLNWHS
jgi:hypothetical protein